MTRRTSYRATVLTPSGLAHVGVDVGARRGRLRVHTTVSGPGRTGVIPVHIMVRATDVADVARGATVTREGDSVHRISLPLTADAREKNNAGVFSLDLARGDDRVVLSVDINGRPLDEVERRRRGWWGAGLLAAAIAVGAVAVTVGGDGGTEKSLASEDTVVDATTVPGEPGTTSPSTTVALDPVVALTTLASTVATSDVPYLLIPRMDIVIPIVDGTSEDKLARGVGRYTWTAKVGGQGNLGLAGHRTSAPAPFRHLETLLPGDAIGIAWRGVLFRYVVEQPDGANQGVGHLVVKPNDVGVLDNRGYGGLTLTTCHPVGSAATRLVVFGKLTDTSLLPGRG